MWLYNTRKSGVSLSVCVWALLGLCLYSGVSVLAHPAVVMLGDETTVLFLLPEVQHVQPQEVFTLEVHIAGNVHELVRFQFALKFNDEAVGVDEVGLGPFLASGGGRPVVIPPSIHNDIGVLIFEAHLGISEPGATGAEGQLAIITGTAQASGESPFRFLNASLWDMAGRRHTPELRTARVIVARPSPSPTSSATATPTATPTGTSTVTSTPTRTLTATPTTTLVHRAFLPIIRKPAVKNGGFETNTFTDWAVSGVLGHQVVSQLYNGGPPKSGQFCALLGNPDWPCQNGVPVGHAVISQRVALPDVPNLSLRLWYRLFSQDASSEERWMDFDRLEVRINGQDVFHWANYESNFGCDKPAYDSGWQQAVVDLDAYRGQPVEVSILNVNHPDNWYNTWTYVDDVAVTW